jgi:hypothetical protein
MAWLSPSQAKAPPVVVRGVLNAAQLAALKGGGAGWEGTLRGLPEKWSLGVVLGGSATGKTALLRECFGGCGGGSSSGGAGAGAGGSGSGGGGGSVAPHEQVFSWTADKAVVSQIGASADENTAALHSCGLASVPAQLVVLQRVRRLNFSAFVHATES